MKVLQEIVELNIVKEIIEAKIVSKIQIDLDGTA